MITKSQLRRAMGEAYGAWYWRTPGRFAFKPGAEGKAERVLRILCYRALRADMNAGRFSPEVNERGNVLLRDADADAALGIRGSDRYAYDCGPCRTWQQMDTWQDAPYFGVWFDDATRRVFTYCEGDRILVECPTVASYYAELGDALEFYRRGRAA